MIRRPRAWSAFALLRRYSAGVRAAVLAIDDAARLQALDQSRLLDSPREHTFDLITQLAVELLEVPVSWISLVTSSRQFFKASTGLREPWATMRQTPISHSFCRRVVERAATFKVEDARLHSQVRTNPAITDLGVIAYLGVPVMVDQFVIGALCAIDSQPRLWRDSDLAQLEDLAGSLSAAIRRGH